MDKLNKVNENIAQNHSGGHAEEEFDIWTYIHFLFEEKWLITGVAAVILLVGFVRAYTATPIYRSDALLQVEETRKTMQGLDDLSAAFGISSSASAASEIEIIRSRSVIGAAIDSLKMAISVTPRYFPFFGKSLASRHPSDEKLANPFLGLSSYAWGGEEVVIDQLDVPKGSISKVFVLRKISKDKYKLLQQSGDEILEGTVGKLEEKLLADGNQYKLFVTKLIANNGAEFELTKSSRTKIIDLIQKNISITERGRSTGILELAFEGENPALIKDILNTISTTYLRQNAERRSAEAQSTLKFLNTQLPELKNKLDITESKLSSFRSQEGNINLNLETKSLLENASNIEKKIEELKLKKSEVGQRYTASHPITIGINKKIKELKKKKVRISKQVKELPEAEQSYIQLMRDVKVANELYLLLLNKAQELKVIKAGTIGNVRILDTALTSEYPVRPKKRRIVISSFFLGILLGLLAAIFRRQVFKGITDPALVEKLFHIPVYANILHSKKQQRLEAKATEKEGDNIPILALEDPKDLSIEGLRSFRTSLQFAMLEADNNIIAISGSSPSIGKSFISVNLPFVLADTDQSVLIIDGDMRRGHMHRYFSSDRSPGLSEYISGNAEFNDVIKSSENKNVSYISSGIIPPNPSELLTSDKFSSLLMQARKEFDLVIIDTPPILAVTDGILISRLAGALFLVLKSGAHHKKEIENMLRRLSQNNIKTNGFMFNDVPLSTIGKYGYKYNYYNYKY